MTYQWISCGLYHSVCITENGHLWAFGSVPEDQTISALEAATHLLQDRNDTLPAVWQKIVCGPYHTVAILQDGRVVAVGRNDYDQCRTQDWKDISMVACGASHTVGLTHRGEALSTGDNRMGQCHTESWQHLIMIACGEHHTVGLRADGTVIAVGDDRLGQCRVEKAKRIVSIACLPEATLCVRDDGCVELYGGTGELKERVSRLKDIVALYTCEYRLCALTQWGQIIKIN